MTIPPDESQIAFTRLFVANQAAFHGYLVSLVHDVHAADDLLQDLAERMWIKFGTYDRGRPFVAWGLGFARLLAMEWRRRQDRLPLPLDDATLSRLADESAGHLAEYDERRDSLRGCLKLLTDHQRKTLHLRYYEERSVAEIARMWRRTEMAIYKVLKHAHQTLLDCLARTSPLPPP